MKTELSPRQQRLLDYLREQIAETGQTPSLRRTAGDLGVSHTAVAEMLKVLEQKGLVKRQGRYGRHLHLLNRAGAPAGIQRIREVPVIGRITAGLPMYAQQQWEESIVVDADLYKGANL
ncbi:MAG: repressor LexA, partial [Desulfosalsimonas sp.]|uniref:LexA family protein n=1 Tax=Desulfosalsimonas sp. TaxID=3073848 RepID=UPI0039709A14